MCQVCVYILIYIYIQISRERERAKQTCLYSRAMEHLILPCEYRHHGELSSAVGLGRSSQFIHKLYMFNLPNLYLTTTSWYMTVAVLNFFKITLSDSKLFFYQILYCHVRFTTTHPFEVDSTPPPRDRSPARRKGEGEFITKAWVRWFTGLASALHPGSYGVAIYEATKKQRGKKHKKITGVCFFEI